MIKRFGGVNIAVKDLDAAVAKYEAVFGVKAIPTDPSDFAFPGLRGASLKVADNIMLNLITATEPGNSIASFLETKGEGVFLLSAQSTDVAADTTDLSAKGVRMVSPEPMPFSAGKVNFAHPKSMHGVQWEIVELTGETKFS